MATSFHWSDLALLIALPVLAYTVCLPLILYCSYLLYQDWEKTYIVKRYRGILVWSIVFIAYQTLGEITFWCFLVLIHPSVEEFHDYPLALLWVIWIQANLMTTARIAFYSIAALRTYLLH